MKMVKTLFKYLIWIGYIMPVYSQDIQNDSVLLNTILNYDQKVLYIASLRSANDYAARLTHTKQFQISYFDIYFNIDDVPVTCVFEYVYGEENDQQYLTIGISLKSARFSLEFYYYNETIEKEWKEQLKAGTKQKIIICNSGTYLQINENEYIKYPENSTYDKKSIVDSLNNMDTTNIHSENESFLNSTSNTLSTKTTAEEISIEVIVPGVPNYLWYQNCSLTSWTMLLGYWNDKGYSNFVPGGNSINGHYWAITDELCLIEYERKDIFGIRYYAQAKEYGNNTVLDEKYFFRFPYLNPDFSAEEFWNLYVKMIDSTQHPMEVCWSGSPYGSHSTVGIGYKVEQDQRFLILNDTWRDVPYYINYDQYNESISFFRYFYPSEPEKSNLKHSASNDSIYSTMGSSSLDPVDLNILPPLNPSLYSYHSFELADLNGDKLDDLIVCNFRNNLYRINPLKIYYNDGTNYFEDTRFNPEILQYQYQCIGISRTFDYDNDGDLDIAVTGFWSYIYIFVNEGGIINSTPIQLESDRLGFIDLSYGDYDLDGDIDLIATSVIDQIKLYENQNGIFTNVLTIEMEGQSYKVRLCDVNKDEYPDLIVSCRRGTVAVFYNNNGKYNATPDFSPVGHGALSFDIADLTNDGWLDIVTSVDGKIIIYHNIFGVYSDEALHINDNLDCYPRDIVAKDLNKDNYPEILIANFNRANIILGNNHGQIDSNPIWQSDKVDPTINIRVFDNKVGEKLLLFGKSRGGDLEFYKMTSLCSVDTVYESISICEGESYEEWTETGQYSRTLTSETGCDSMVVTNLTVNLINTITENVSICEGEGYEGWTETGQYSRTLTSETGCDSMVVTNLTVNPINTITENVSICEEESYEGWTETGQYSRTLTSVTGCDSIIVTNLTVNPLPSAPTITQSGDTLISDAQLGNQWFLNDNVINGANEQNYIVSESGIYYVIVTDITRCFSVPSNTINVIYSSILSLGKTRLLIFPNPADEQIIVQGLPNASIIISIYDLDGNLLFIQNTDSTETTIDISLLPKGTYLIVFNKIYKQAVKFIKY
jgi:Secretion system C-terminal sorting domain/FG-GAP-like repeat